MFRTPILTLAATAALSFAQTTEDFEGGLPSTWTQYAPDCQQGGSVSLDTSIAHGGSNSLKVVGAAGGGYCGHIFFGTTNVPSGDVFVRTWLRHTTPISDGHVTFIVMPDTTLSGKHLRVSGQMGIVEYNRESDDATLPDLSPQGVASSVKIPTNEWHCLEYHLSPSSSVIETWFDGTAVDGLTTPNDYDNGWGTSYKPSIKGVYFGWESYAGSADTWWYDDIAISSSRVGCSGGGGGSSPTTKGTTTAKPTSTTTKATSTTTPTTTKPTTTHIITDPITTTPTTMTTKTSTTTATSACATKYGQCGGQGWQGPTCCASGSTCKSSGQYYSQCL